MHYFVTIVYNVTSGSAINLGRAIASGSFLVSKQVLRCQRVEGRLNVSLFLWKTNN